MPKQSSGIDRTRRIVLRKYMRELEGISRRIATGFTKYDVFCKALLTVFAGFWGFENVWCQNRVVE